jgi:hypothetical protein
MPRQRPYLLGPATVNSFVFKGERKYAPHVI